MHGRLEKEEKLWPRSNQKVRAGVLPEEQPGPDAEMTTKEPKFSSFKEKLLGFTEDNIPGGEDE